MAQAVQKAKKTKKQRKHGRNADFCKRYRLSNRRERSKVARLKKRVLRFPQDLVAVAAIDRLTAIIRGVV